MNKVQVRTDKSFDVLYVVKVNHKDFCKIEIPNTAINREIEGYLKKIPELKVFLDNNKTKINVIQGRSLNIINPNVKLAPKVIEEKQNKRKEK